MRSQRAVITAFSVLLLLMAVGHTMGRVIYARTFTAMGVRFGYTSLFEVVLMVYFAALCALTPTGAARPPAWTRAVKAVLWGLLLFGSGFHLVGGEQQNLAMQLGISGPLLAQATFYDDAGHWLLITVVSCLLAVMGYQEIVDPAQPALTARERGLVVAEGLLLAAGASLTAIISHFALWFVLICLLGLLVLAFSRPLRSPLSAYASSFFSFSLVLVTLWALLPVAVREQVLRPYAP